MLRRLALSLTVTVATFAAGPAFACADQAERVIGNVRSDLRTRNVGQQVGERLVQELTEAANHCRAGRTAQGEAILRRIALQFNYR
jgi:chorismate mutase